MKKIFLTAIALLSMASAQVFGMYGTDSSWIDFLTHGNQFRARINQLGFTLGNDTIKGTFGFHSGANGMHGSYANTNTLGKIYYNFNPTISMGLAYTSSPISVGVGYNATIGKTKWEKYNGKDNPKTTEAVVHTPVLALNAMDNAFRMVIPIQVLHLTDKYPQDVGKGSITAVSLDAQFRYYTGFELVPQIRLYLKYGTYQYNFEQTGQEKQKGTIAESFGFQFRLYFGTTVEEVALNPFIRIDYNTALGKQHSQKNVTAVGVLDAAATMTVPDSTTGAITPTPQTAAWGTSVWELKILPSLGLTANSDIVSLYLQPSLGFGIYQDGDPTQKNVKEAFKLAYDVYAEIYLRPLQNLEWYFEANIGNSGTPQAGLEFALSTGATWYLPQL